MPTGFKPLHSGAGLLSNGYLKRSEVMATRFKPLHSGAGLLSNLGDAQDAKISAFQTPS